MTDPFLSLAIAFGPSPAPIPAPPVAPASPPAIVRPADPTPPGSAPPIPPRWRLADASGQAWEHPDRATLEGFVAARNMTMIRPAPTYFLAPAPRCGPGGCPRR